VKFTFVLLSFMVLGFLTAYGANSPAANKSPKIANVIAGDANSSGQISTMDALFLAKYIKGRGPAPRSLIEGDANGDCHVDLRDITYLVAYFSGRGGPKPHSGNCH
jgi:hypothetical protein